MIHPLIFPLLTGFFILITSSNCKTAPGDTAIDRTLNGYIGKQLPDSALTGYILLTSGSATASNKDLYSISSYMKGADKLILMQKMEPVQKNGKRKEHLRSYIHFMSEERFNFFVHKYCYYGNDDRKWEHDIIALVDAAGDVKYYRNIQRAWRIDVDKEKFIKIDPAGLTCLNISWGAD